jgi:hypothetical protein
VRVPISPVTVWLLLRYLQVSIRTLRLGCELHTSGSDTRRADGSLRSLECAQGPRLSQHRDCGTD